jgi:hypothetical protein
MALASAIFGFRDYSEETSNVALDLVVPADGAGFEGQEILIDGIAVAFKALSLANLNWYGSRYIQNDQLGAPTDPFAQRELGLQLYWRETSGDDPAKGLITLPAPDLDIVASPATDEVDLGITEVGAAVAAVEALWNAALPVNREIYRARIVGRKS